MQRLIQDSDNRRVCVTMLRCHDDLRRPMYAARAVSRVRSAAAARPFSRVALCAVLLLMLGTSQALAATATTLYVDRSNSACSNSGVGSQSHPFCTITAAASKVAPGQTVRVAAGTYPEVVRVPVSGTSGAQIKFTAASG